MNQILPTKSSQRKVQKIVEHMEGQTFHHHFHILYDIISSIEKDNINYFEIGSYCGASGSLVLSHNKKVSAFCLDTFSEAPIDLVERNFKKFKNPNSEFSFIVGDSQTEEIIDNVKTIVKDVDLFYIDGNHTFEGCVNDFLNYNDLVKNGGYIAFDDYHDVEYSPQVKHAVDFIISDLTYGQYEVIGSFRNSFKTYPSEMPYNNLFIIRKR
jgi:cephalosporin hydroxylase